MTWSYWAVKIGYREIMPQKLASSLHNLKILRCKKQFTIRAIRACNLIFLWAYAYEYLEPTRKSVQDARTHTHINF
jgi:hypothetical protein